MERELDWRLVIRADEHLNTRNHNNVGADSLGHVGADRQNSDIGLQQNKPN